MDPYRVLDIPRNSTLKEIRTKYFSLVRQYHPDKNNGTTTQKFQEIEAAYKSVYKSVIDSENARDTKNTGVKSRPNTNTNTNPPPKPPKPPKPPPEPAKPEPPKPKFKKGQSLDDFLNDLMNDGRKKLGKKKDKWS